MRDLGKCKGKAFAAWLPDSLFACFPCRVSLCHCLTARRACLWDDVGGVSYCMGGRGVANGVLMR